MRRFYEKVGVTEAPDGFMIALDGRAMKTPGKDTLLLPTAALAEAVADEWQAQGEQIDAKAMPITRLANTTIDRVAPRFELVASEISGFAATDMLCYRADDPPELAVQQKTVWDPYLMWAVDRFSAPLKTATGIMPVAQEEASLVAFGAEVRACTPFELTALSEFTNGFGSLVLALAYMDGYAAFEPIWQASLLDQMFQEGLWGEDLEAKEKRDILLNELGAARLFLSCLPSKITGKQP